MKKIICPRCGAVNLEKFVTYPHCAGCSALLSLEEAGAGESLWRRPVRVGLWASLLGGALLAIAALAAREVGQGESQDLVVFGHVTRRVEPGASVVCRLSFDVVEAPTPRHLRDLTLVLARNFGRDWEVIAIEPAPDDRLSSGGRAILRYERWSTDQAWMLRVKARRPGKNRLAFSVSARDYGAAQWRGLGTVAPQALPPAKAP